MAFLGESVFATELVVDRVRLAQDSPMSFATDETVAQALAPYSTTAETDAARLSALSNYYDSAATDTAINTALSQIQNQTETHYLRVSPAENDPTIIHSTVLPSSITFANDENANVATITSNATGWLRISSDSTLMLAHKNVAKLRVFSSSILADASLNCNGNITYSGSLSQTSDARVKHDIVDADVAEAYERIKKLPIRQFEYNDGSPLMEWGVVAQEVKAVYPNATRILHGGYDSSGREILEDDATPVVFRDKHVVKTDRLYQMLLAAFQHSQSLITDLQERVASLEGV